MAWLMVGMSRLFFLFDLGFLFLFWSGLKNQNESSSAKVSINTKDQKKKSRYIRKVWTQISEELVIYFLM